MKILFLAANYYTSPSVSKKSIYAPRDFAISLVNGLVAQLHEVFFSVSSDVESDAQHHIKGEDILLQEQCVLNQLLLHNRRMSDQDSKRKDQFVENLYSRSYFYRKNYYEVELISRTIDICSKEKVDIVCTDFPLVHFFENFFPCPVLHILHAPLPSKGSVEYWLLDKFRQHKYISISSDQQKGELNLRFVGTIHHGINTSEYEFDSQGGDDLLFLGRVVEEKGLDIAIETAIKLQKKLKIGSDIIHWTGEQYYEETIKPYLANPYIMAPQMYLGDEKIEVYQKSRVLLFPIKWREPFGLVMIEAMSCGTPVVAFGCGSVPEIIVDGVTGYVIAPGDIESFHDAVRKIYRMSDERYISMRHACRAHVEQNFSLETMVKKYIAIFSNVVNAQSR